MRVVKSACQHFPTLHVKDFSGWAAKLCIDQQERVVRANFMHEAIDERDAKSCLTMMAQLAWENERNYQPAPIPSSDSN